MINASRTTLARINASMPPIGFLLLSVISVQFGAAFSKTIFGVLGPAGVVALRATFGFIVISLMVRPKWRQYSRNQYTIAALFGFVTAAMMLAFYASLERIPLGVAVTLEFVGPLGMSLLSSRKPLDFVWVVLAGLGVLLLSPIGSREIDPIGAILSITGGVFWALYIQLSSKTAKVFPGNEGLAVSLAFTSLLLLPIGVINTGSHIIQPNVLVNGFALACLSLIIPFSLEMEGLRRVPPRVWSIFLSLEPAVATLIGLIVLGEVLSIKAVIAIIMVTAASYGATRFHTPSPEQPEPPVQPIQP